MSLIVEGFESPELQERIQSSSAKKFIYELNFKYGLRVLTTQNGEFLMCPKDSDFVVTSVWEEDGDFNYRSPFYRKSRGRTTAERETIHSKKLSSLMATIARNGVVPDSLTVYESHRRAFSHAHSTMNDHFGRVRKPNDLSGEEVHSMVRAIVSGNTDNIDINFCKELLDKYDAVDKIKESRDSEVSRFFDDEVWCIGADRLDHIVIGSVRRVLIMQDKFDLVQVKPFKRYHSIHAREEFIAPLTMLKVSVQDKENQFFGNFIPARTEYYSDLDMITTCSSMVDNYNFAWAMMPCKTVN